MCTPMLAPPSGATIRMYNPGFGDCLLLAFPSDSGEDAHYMLIDFGVHQSYGGGAKRSRLVAQDIARATNSHLHLVAITHDHTDHVSGFRHAQQVLEDSGIAVDELWLAWTEDKHNKLARELKDRFGTRAKALDAAALQLERAGARSASVALRAVLDFEAEEVLAAKGDESSELRYLRDKALRAPEKGNTYLKPGQPPLSLPGVAGVRFYVLAPPENAEWIGVLEAESEAYPDAVHVNEDTAFAAAVFAAAGALKGAEKELFDRTRPFGEALGLSPDAMRSHPLYEPFFRTHYGFSEDDADGPAWRRIDNDWLGAAEQLALKINDETNNTSLVLAVELTESEPHKVLLFAADAQAGNWLSWHELCWPAECEGGDPVTVENLLERTVLYKVGHHGSHNATLRAKGLEMMSRPDLVAMIPVDEVWANARNWMHPAKGLYDRLIEKTHGRVIRSDEIPKSGKVPARPDEATDAEWNAYLSQLSWDTGEDRLWIQYTVPG